MIIKDLKSGNYMEIYDPNKLSAFNPLLETVEVYDKGNGNIYRFKIGDAKLAGIEVKDAKTLPEFVKETEIPDWLELEIESDSN